MPNRSYRWLMFALAAFGFVADQASKYGMFNWLPKSGAPAPAAQGEIAFEKGVIPGTFKLHARFAVAATHHCDCPLARWNGPVPPAVNHGALFSLGGEHKADANVFFAIVSVLAAIGISIWGLRKATAKDRWLCIALGLILGGTVGNLFDRVVFGGVRDFLYFYLIEWPVFNVADSCLVVGAGLLLVQAVFGKKPEAAAATSAPATPTPATA